MIKDTETDYIISTDKSNIDIDYVHEYLSTKAFWSMGRSKEVVVKSIECAMCFSIFDKSTKQVGFARVITDHSTFAYLSDVFVDEQNRGQGLSKKLIQYILEHPRLSDINRWMLLTKDAHGLYSKFGFRNTIKSNWIMEMVNDQI